MRYGRTFQAWLMKNSVINKLTPVQSAAAGLQGLGRQA